MQSDKSDFRSDKIAVYLDASAVVLVSAAILAASANLLFMKITVVSVICVRMLLIRYFIPENFLGECIFYLLCVLIGGFNDWNSVVRHRVYSYTVPTDLEFSSIPSWMLLYWGQILRFIAGLGIFLSKRQVSNATRLSQELGKNGWFKIIFSLGLVLGTRQCIYRLFHDPLWSWLPFLIAIAIYIALFKFQRSDWQMLAAAALCGPLVEALYIRLGKLHFYEHGIFIGVPLWIMLWWILSAVIWQDLAQRFLGFLELKRRRNA